MIDTFTMRSDADGLELSGMSVLPDDGAPIAVLQVAHGMSEHKERYLPLMKFLAKQGIGSYIHDCRGHGASMKRPEDKGYFYAAGANGVVEDLHQMTQHIRAQYPNVPIVLLGHSMGSLAVRVYISRYDRDIDGLLVCGSVGKNPAVDFGLLLTRILKHVQGEHHVSKTMAALSTGGYNRRFASEGSSFAWLSANRENVRAYDADPLCGFPFTLNGYEALLTLLKQTYGAWEAKNKKLPIRFLSGEDDPCMPNEPGFHGALTHLRNNGYECVHGQLYPGMRHEIISEKDKLLVWNGIADFTESVSARRNLA